MPDIRHRAVAAGPGYRGAMNRAAATLTGFTAVLMWSLLALLTAASGQVPPFQRAVGWVPTHPKHHRWLV